MHESSSNSMNRMVGILIQRRLRRKQRRAKRKAMKLAKTKALIAKRLRAQKLKVVKQMTKDCDESTKTIQVTVTQDPVQTNTLPNSEHETDPIPSGESNNEPSKSESLPTKSIPNENEPTPTENLPSEPTVEQSPSSEQTVTIAVETQGDLPAAEQTAVPLPSIVQTESVQTSTSAGSSEQTPVARNDRDPPAGQESDSTPIMESVATPTNSASESVTAGTSTDTATEFTTASNVEASSSKTEIPLQFPTLLPPFGDRVRDPNAPISKQTLFTGNQDQQQKDDGQPINHLPLIAGLAVSAVVVVFLVLLATYLFRKSSRKFKSPAQGNDGPSNDFRSVPKTIDSTVKDDGVFSKVSSIFSNIFAQSNKASPKEALANAVKTFPTLSKYNLKSMFYKPAEHTNYNPNIDFRNADTTLDNAKVENIQAPKSAKVKDSFNSMYSQVARDYGESLTDEELDAFDLLSSNGSNGTQKRRQTGFENDFEPEFTKQNNRISATSDDIFLDDSEVLDSPIRFTNGSGLSVPIHLNTPTEQDRDSFMSEKVYDKFEKSSHLSDSSVIHSGTEQDRRTTGFSYDLEFIEEQLALNNNHEYKGEVEEFNSSSHRNSLESEYSVRNTIMTVGTVEIEFER